MNVSTRPRGRPAGASRWSRTSARMMPNKPRDLDAATRMLAELWALPVEVQMGTMAVVFDAFVRVDRTGRREG